MSPQNTHGRHYAAPPKPPMTIDAAKDLMIAALEGAGLFEPGDRVEWLHKVVGDRLPHLPFVDMIAILLALDDAPSLTLVGLEMKIAELEEINDNLEARIRVLER